MLLHDSCLVTEELFGPVLPVMAVPDLDAAITCSKHNPVRARRIGLDKKPPHAQNGCLMKYRPVSSG